MEVAEERDVVIIGGGICGLATALALHRKNIRSVVLERSETLRATGAGIGIRPNGWRALEQLGVASKLRPTATPVLAQRFVWLDRGSQKIIPFSSGETRCLKRSDLINALADDLPHGTIRFGSKLLSLKLDLHTSFPILQLDDGSFIKAKVVIGCDGVNSVIADFLDLKPTKVFSTGAVRGLSDYPSCHSFSQELVITKKGDVSIGRVPVSDKLIYWFVSQWRTQDLKILKDADLIRQSTLELIQGFPAELVEMIKMSDPDSLSSTQIRYRAPWHLLSGSFRKGTVTVAGDAMHVMGPFLGQGGSAGLEDAIVLARCLHQKLIGFDLSSSPTQIIMQKVGESFDEYVRERRMRVVMLSLQAYLTGFLMGSPSMLVKLLSVIFMVIFFRDTLRHTRYDCGGL
ncbi:FAD-binding domain [Dillenia turbinata]|uniref:FAD-binding domain n=1 Tax=Dillenia turbinata TaxID=194707 RepID=A0AAN8ZGP4_9MAGN